MRHHRPQPTLRPQLRSGWTLIEMMVSIAVIGVMTGMSVKLLTTLLNAERNGIAHVTRLATISRLSRQFRADVHAAQTLEMNQADQTQPLVKIVATGGRQIRYEVQPTGLLRTEQSAAQPVIGKELMRLKGSRFRVVDTPGPPRVLTLVVETPDPFAARPALPASPSRELHIDAIVGRQQ